MKRKMDQLIHKSMNKKIIRGLLDSTLLITWIAHKYSLFNTKYHNSIVIHENGLNFEGRV